MLKSLATLAALTALTSLAVPAANAAGLSPNLNIHSTNGNTTTLAPGRTYTYGPHQAPPIPSHTSNSNFDDPTGNLNPGSGGGGSGTTVVKKPNLQ